MTPKASDMLRQQRERIMSGELKWVPHAPIKDGEACLAYEAGVGFICNSLENGAPYRNRIGMLVESALQGALKEIHDYDSSYSRWNDSQTGGVSAVIEVLELAEKFAAMEETDGY